MSRTWGCSPKPVGDHPRAVDGHVVEEDGDGRGRGVGGHHPLQELKEAGAGGPGSDQVELAPAGQLDGAEEGPALRGPHRDASRGTPSELAPMGTPRWGAPWCRGLGPASGCPSQVERSQGRRWRGTPSEPPHMGTPWRWASSSASRTEPGATRRSPVASAPAPPTHRDRPWLPGGAGASGPPPGPGDGGSGPTSEDVSAARAGPRWGTPSEPVPMGTPSRPGARPTGVGCALGAGGCPAAAAPTGGGR